LKALSFKEIAGAVGSAAAFEGTVTGGVCTDSRKVKPGCLFIAIKGDRFDGHDFIGRAFAEGAAAVICERVTGEGAKEIIVKDTRRALLDLAAYYRRLFAIPVIGITGSVGKTTTKEMTAAVLSCRFKTLKNEGNLNNEIGLPTTVFNLDDSYEAAVIEMGMSGLGEISKLSRTARPTIGIITNIGVSHIEKLGSRENILRAKTEIFDGMDEDAPLVFNGDDDLLYNLKKRNHPVFYFGVYNKYCRFKAYEIEQDKNRTVFTLDYGSAEQRISLPVAGTHYIYNALAAFGAGFLLGIAPAEAAEALSAYKPSGMRQRVTGIGGITFIEDCYNSSPDSLSAALDVLRDTDAERRIAVLGDMLELGGITAAEHSRAGERAAESGVDILLTYGEKSKHTAASAAQAGVRTVLPFHDKEALAEQLLSLMKKGDAVLFKASRGMKLEEVIQKVYKELKADE